MELYWQEVVCQKGKLLLWTPPVAFQPWEAAPTKAGTQIANERHVMPFIVHTSVGVCVGQNNGIVPASWLAQLEVLIGRYYPLQPNGPFQQIATIGERIYPERIKVVMTWTLSLYGAVALGK